MDMVLGTETGVEGKELLLETSSVSVANDILVHSQQFARDGYQSH